MLLGLLWFAASLAGAFIILVARLPRLNLIELLAGSVAVGTIGSAWAVYLVACLTSAIG
jgi:hypothetical protein